jgi:hypothetical protein
MDSEKFQWLVDYGRLLMPSADRLGDPLFQLAIKMIM